jgi:nitrite reductase (NADH) large subunit
LPRQLDHDAAAALEQTLTDAGLELRTRCSIERIERAGQSLRIRLQGGEEILASFAVAAVGARASDEVARSAGLRCHARGGIEVDAQLCTSDPHVFAIGECGSHAAVPHGLVAPGYVMANVLAERLVGSRSKLRVQSAVTRLKLDLTEVTVIGDPVRASATKDLVWKRPGQYRRLVIKDDRISAAICLGSWDELCEVQSAAAGARKLPRKALALFEAEGRLGLSGARAGVATWPDEAVVCQCANVTCGTLRRAALTCPGDVDALARATGASSLCGSCRPLLVTLSGSSARPGRDRRQLVFGLAAASALLLAASTLLLPRIPLAESVLAQRLDAFFIEPVFKQVSGFAVLGLVAAGLTFSLRKRVARFRLSSYPTLRVVHGVLGALALVALFLHTGFRLGANLNLLLMVTFLVSSLSGALVGIFKNLLSARQLPRLSKAAGFVERAHEVSFWALPALVSFHALKTYYF